MAGLRALVAGNDESTSKMITESLEELNIKTVRVGDYKQAFDKLEYEKPDIAVFNATAGEMDEEIRSMISGLNEYTVSDLTNLKSENFLKSLFIVENSDQIQTLLESLKLFVEKEADTLQPDFLGALDNFQYPELLIKLYREKRTGTLVVDSSVKLRIYFIYGTAVFAEGGEVETAFGKILLNSDKISQKEYEKALKLNSVSDQKIGHTLIEIGLISPTELNDILALQVSEKIISCFNFVDASYYFKNQDNFINNIVTYHLNPLKLIYEGIKRHLRGENLKKALRLKNGVGYDVVLTNHPREELDSCSISSEEFEILMSIQDAASIGELIKKSDLDENKILQFIYFLNLLGLISIHESHSSESYAEALGQSNSIENNLGGAEVHETIPPPAQTGGMFVDTDGPDTTKGTTLVEKDDENEELDLLDLKVSEEDLLEQTGDLEEEKALAEDTESVVNELNLDTEEPIEIIAEMGDVTAEEIEIIDEALTEPAPEPQSNEPTGVLFAGEDEYIIDLIDEFEIEDEESFAASSQSSQNGQASEEQAHTQEQILEESDGGQDGQQNDSAALDSESESDSADKEPVPEESTDLTETALPDETEPMETSSPVEMADLPEELSLDAVIPEREDVAETVMEESDEKFDFGLKDDADLLVTNKEASREIPKEIPVETPSDVDSSDELFVKAHSLDDPIDFNEEDLSLLTDLFEDGGDVPLREVSSDVGEGSAQGSSESRENMKLSEEVGLEEVAPTEDILIEDSVNKEQPVEVSNEEPIVKEAAEMAAAEIENEALKKDSSKEIDRDLLKEEIMALGGDSPDLSAKDDTSVSAQQTVEKEEPKEETIEAEASMKDAPSKDITSEDTQSVEESTDSLQEPKENEPQKEVEPQSDELSANQIQIIEEINKLLPVLDKKDHYQVLNIEKSANQEAIKAAYFFFAKKFHPDRNQFLDEDMRTKAEVVFVRISNAYSTLSDPAKRKEYDAIDDIGIDQEQVKDLFEAEIAYKEGEAALKRKDYKTALGYFKNAQELNPEEPEYWGTLAWVRFLLEPNKDAILSEVRVELNNALEKAPKSAPLYFYTGHILKYSGRMALAEQNFAMSVKLDSTNIDAKRELWLLQRRKPDSSKSRGKNKSGASTKTFWSNIFKKS